MCIYTCQRSAEFTRQFRQSDPLISGRAVTPKSPAIDLYPFIVCVYMYTFFCIDIYTRWLIILIEIINKRTPETFAHVRASNVIPLLNSPLTKNEQEIYSLKATKKKNEDKNELK